MIAYRIGKLNILSQILLPDAFDAFKIQVNCDDVCDVEIRSKEKAAQSEEAEFCVRQDQFDVLKLKGRYLYQYKPFPWEMDVPAQMEVDDTYGMIWISNGCGQEYLIRLALECRLIKEGCISLHSAALIAPDMKAVCMTGNSGVGKSTRLASWREAMELELISGDRPIIDVNDLYVYGAPWDGKEGLHKCIKAPLGSILNIVRADGTVGAYDISGMHMEYIESRIRLLSENEAFRILIAQTYIPMWDTDLAALTMTNLKKLCAGAKVYELVSGPDERAALCSWEKLNGNNASHNIDIGT